MLRQFHIIYNGERVFSHTFALAFENKEIENVANTIISKIEIPSPGKILSRRISEHQIFYKKFQNICFITVTDLIDSIDYIEDILDKAITKFNVIYHNIESLKYSESVKKEFINYLIKLQAELHCKISIIGPTNAGKSTLYTLLTKHNKERNIMNFAKVSILDLYELKFDVWDFQLKDNFSLLWPKFIRGSDLVLFVFNAANYNLKVLNYFLTLKKKESNLSRFIIIANKMDLISERDIKKIKNELNFSNITFLSFINSDDKQEVFDLIRNALELKKALPDNFNELIKSAEKMIEEKNIVKALATYKELIILANSCQCYNYLDDFKRIVKEIEEKLNERVAIRKKIERKKKFAPPKQISFTKEIKVKQLPKIQKYPEITNEKPIKTEKSKLKLTHDDIAIKKSSEILKVVMKNPEEKYNDISEIPDKAQLLQEMIEFRGSNLNLDLCNKFIMEIKNSLKRELTLDDLKRAANIFIKK